MKLTVKIVIKYKLPNECVCFILNLRRHDLQENVFLCSVYLENLNLACLLTVPI